MSGRKLDKEVQLDVDLAILEYLIWSAIKALLDDCNGTGSRRKPELSLQLADCM